MSPSGVRGRSSTDSSLPTSRRMAFGSAVLRASAADGGRGDSS
ncbi:Uncharacterised protein [Mycobacteroides abscessus]|nr:Uncharacterised protein [Mycobacteroides abscessus]